MPTILSDPAIRRLAAARLVSMASAEGVFFVGIWGRAAFEMQADAGDIARLMLAFSLAGIAGGVLAGPLVDRLGPRPVLLGAEAAMVVAALALLATPTLGALTAVSAAWAFVGLVAHTAMAAAGPFLVRGEAALTRANAVIEQASVLAFAIGPAAAAALVTVAPLPVLFVVDAVTSVVALGILWRLPRVREPLVQSEPSDGGPTTRSAAPVRVGLPRVVADALADPRLRFPLVAGFIVYVSFGMLGALEPLFFRDVLATDPAALGWINSVFGVGLLIGAVLIERAGARLTRELPTYLLTVASGLGAVAYVVTDRLAVVVVAAVGWGLVLGLLLPTLRTLVQLSAPPSRLGRVSSIVSVSETAGDLLPLVVAPAAAAAVGVQPTLVASGVAVVVLAALLGPSAWRLDHSTRRARGGSGAPAPHAAARPDLPDDLPGVPSVRDRGKVRADPDGPDGDDRP